MRKLFVGLSIIIAPLTLAGCNDKSAAPAENAAANAESSAGPVNDDEMMGDTNVTDHAPGVTDHAPGVTDHAPGVTDHAPGVTDHAPIAKDH